MNSTTHHPGEAPAPGGPSRPIQLAIETIGSGGSLAILQGDVVLQTEAVDVAAGQRGTSQLAVCLAAILGRIAGSGHAIEFVSVAAGPGSFTGLRVGVTTAKSFAYAKNIPIVAVNSLAAIAATLPTSPPTRSLLVALNAYQQQVYLGRFAGAVFQADPPADWVTAVADASLITMSQWRQIAHAADRDVIAAGDAAIFADTPLRAIDRDVVDAVGVGRIAARLYARGHIADAMTLVPNYLKPSAAQIAKA